MNKPEVKLRTTRTWDRAHWVAIGAAVCAVMGAATLSAYVVWGTWSEDRARPLTTTDSPGEHDSARASSATGRSGSSAPVQAGQTKGSSPQAVPPATPPKQTTRGDGSLLQQLNQASEALVAGASPAVVQIETLQQVLPGADANSERSAQNRPPFDPRAGQQGSGVVVDSEGLIVTNQHVIRNAHSIQVTFADGTRVTATRLGADSLTDLALLKVDRSTPEFLRWGDSERLRPGSLVWAIGSPFGLRETVTLGIVSARTREGLAGPMNDFLQIDAAINPGNSGGALVNAEGELIGINTAILGESYQGIGFAIPSNLARQVIQVLKRDGQIQRGWIGASLQALDPAESKGKDELGVLVTSVEANSPASRAGLQAGDRIQQWNDIRVPTPITLTRLIAATQVGTVVRLRVWREGATRAVEIEVQARASRERLP